MSAQLRSVHSGNRHQAEHLQHSPVPYNRVQGPVQGCVKPLTAASCILFCLSMISATGSSLVQERECSQWGWDVEDAEQDVQHANSTLADIQKSYKSREELMMESEAAYCRELKGVTPQILKSASHRWENAHPFDSWDARWGASKILDIDNDCKILAKNRVKMVRSLDPDLCEIIKAAVPFPEHTPLVCYAKQERDAKMQLKKMKDRLAARLEKKPPFCHGRKPKKSHMGRLAH